MQISQSSNFPDSFRSISAGRIFPSFWSVEEIEKEQSGLLKSWECFFQISNWIIGVFIFHALIAVAIEKLFHSLLSSFSVFSLRYSTKSSTSPVLIRVMRLRLLIFFLTNSCLPPVKVIFILHCRVGKRFYRLPAFLSVIGGQDSVAHPTYNILYRFQGSRGSDNFDN